MYNGDCTLKTTYPSFLIQEAVYEINPAILDSNNSAIDGQIQNLKFDILEISDGVSLKD